MQKKGELLWCSRALCGHGSSSLAFWVWVISASHWRVAQGIEAASCSCSLRRQVAPVREPWLSPDYLPCLPPSSADPDPHGRNIFTA